MTYKNPFPYVGAVAPCSYRRVYSCTSFVSNTREFRRKSVSCLQGIKLLDACVEALRLVSSTGSELPVGHLLLVIMTDVPM